MSEVLRQTSITNMDGSGDGTDANDLYLNNEEEHKTYQPPNKKPRKRLKVGELSGRQMALRKIKEEEKSTSVKWSCSIPPPFGDTVLKIRTVLMGFVGD